MLTGLQMGFEQPGSSISISVLMEACLYEIQCMLLYMVAPTPGLTLIYKHAYKYKGDGHVPRTSIYLVKHRHNFQSQTYIEPNQLGSGIQVDLEYMPMQVLHEQTDETILHLFNCLVHLHLPPH